MALYHIRLRKDSPLIFSVIGVNLLAEQLILTDMFVLVLIYIYIYLPAFILNTSCKLMPHCDAKTEGDGWVSHQFLF